MKHFEIILSQAMDEEFLRRLQLIGAAKNYTKIVNAEGEGNTSPKHGDAIWPQFNNVYLISCNEDEGEKIKKAVKFIRDNYPDEGIACFISDVEEF